MKARSVPIIGVLLGLAALTHARTSAAATLDSIGTNWPELNLQASLANAGTDAGSYQVEQGSNIQLRVSADDEASVAIILVNPEGQAHVTAPRRSGTGDRIVRGTEMIFPDLLSGEVLYADMPVGKGYAYVLASEKAVLDIPSTSDAPQWTPAQALADRLAAMRQSDPQLRLAVRRIPFHVMSAATKDFVSTEEFVQFFGIATRSVKDADRGFRIEFQTGSAALTDWSRRQLDAVGKGMVDKRLAGFPFMIEGHTDDVGSDDYNMSLSARRAQTVRSYLAGLGIDTARLDSSAMGESKPAVEGDSEKARAANRRVVIRRLDKSRRGSSDQP